MKSGYGRKGKLVCLLFLFTQYCFVPSVSVEIRTPVGKSLLEMKVSGAHCDGILPQLICSRKDPGVSRCSSGQGPEAHLLKSLFWWLTCVHGRAALAEARRGCWVAWIGSDTWSWSAWCGCWDSSLGPLKEYVLFTAEPSLPPPKAFSVDFSFFKWNSVKRPYQAGSKQIQTRTPYFLIASFLHCVRVPSLVLSWVSSSFLELHLSCPTTYHSFLFLTGLLLCAPPTLSFWTSKTRMG